MLEWSKVEPKKYVDPLTGEGVTMRIRHVPDPVLKRKDVDVDGRDLDLIAREEMETYEEFQKLCEANSGILSEYDFDINKLRKLVIPA
ncbi:hypothetical protein [Leptospira andrefontaineae]|uniref:Uncharacterized protein n=1 Tax=Leptospira andrefontaineae TaxID=2484976 RepID=A0A4R9GY61_9LEPT|nr:hypothetical protein [Leptospira andrefontaineae]TGK36278.1 hypothetical protein EHO65_18430 [Leptospira andrefontaineae]